MSKDDEIIAEEKRVAFSRIAARLVVKYGVCLSHVRVALSYANVAREKLSYYAPIGYKQTGLLDYKEDRFSIESKVNIVLWRKLIDETELSGKLGTLEEKQLATGWPNGCVDFTLENCLMIYDAFAQDSNSEMKPCLKIVQLSKA